MKEQKAYLNQKNTVKSKVLYTMLKKILILFLATLGVIISAYVILKVHRSYRPDTLKPAWPQQILATYDTSTNTIIRNTDSILHYTLSWVNNAESSLPKEKLQSLAQKKLPLFLNLQIWSRGLIKKIDENVTETILKGVYDKKLIALFKLLASHPGPVYLRFNAEMELPQFKYPWQNQSGPGYIRSFRYVSLMCRKYSPAVKIVWGPAGYPGTEEYWPGSEYADLVSINMNISPELSKNPYPPYISTTEMIRRKLFRLRFINKQVLLLGSATVNRATIQQQWLSELNSKLIMDKAVFRTPVIPLEPERMLPGKERDSTLKIGVYDPMLLLAHEPQVTAEHLFPNMGTVKDGSFKQEFDAVVARKHDIIVTMEAWKDGKTEKDTSILINTLNGVYDEIWTKLYQIISNAGQTVYLRWGHEMEIPVDRYPWQQQDPVTYIKAFRYFVNFPKYKAGNVKMVWGPAGDRGSVEFWPGDDVVDFVSIAIYGLPDKNINDYNKQKSFTSIFLNKYHRVRFAQPLFITEFGVKGPEDIKRNGWQRLLPPSIIILK
ncbi:MAG: hypothetical protein WKI04_09605 [Ferruginibacter sp.]